MFRRLAVLVLLSVPVGLAGQDPAADAWNNGDHETAERLYGEILAEDSTNQTALHRMSLMLAWSDRHDDALRLMDRMLTLYPTHVDARIDRARIRAWRGDLNQAISELEAVIQEHPANLRALQAQAQFAGWAGETDQAMQAYNRIMDITPDDVSIRRNQARILTMANRLTDARFIYDSLLQVDPTDEPALLALGQLLSWNGQLDSAATIYRQVLRRNPRHIGALQGEARTVTWSGDLREGEARWRRTLEIEPDNVVTLVGLAQTLRWQGRPGAALDLLNHALDLSPNDRDVLTQLRWTESAIEPRASTVVTQESDSDGNRVQTTLVRTAWRPTPAVQTGVDVYRRVAAISTQPMNSPTSVGVSVSFRAQAEPGWSAHTALGFRQLSGASSRTVGSYTVGVASPNRERVVGSLTWSRSTFDYTRALIDNGVTMGTLDFNGRMRINRSTNMGLGMGYARFNGSVSNRRLSTNVNVTTRLSPQWSTGGFLRFFGFQADVNDGYFDPNYFGLLEGLVRWNRNRDRWSLQFELAPGLQQVRTATVNLTVRTAARVGYTIAPGRDISLQGAYSSVGLENIATTSSDYRYYAVSLAASWLF